MPIKHTHAHVLHAPCTLHEKHTLYAYSIYETHNTYNTNKRTIRTLHILHTYTQDSLYMSSSIVVSRKLAHRKHQGQIKGTHKIYILDIPHVRHITYTQHTQNTQHTEHRHATYTCTYHLHIRHSHVPCWAFLIFEGDVGKNKLQLEIDMQTPMALETQVSSQLTGPWVAAEFWGRQSLASSIQGKWAR